MSPEADPYATDRLRADVVELTPQILRSLQTPRLRHELGKMVFVDAGHADRDLRLTPGGRGAHVSGRRNHRSVRGSPTQRSPSRV